MDRSVVGSIRSVSLDQSAEIQRVIHARQARTVRLPRCASAATRNLARPRSHASVGPCTGDDHTALAGPGSWWMSWVANNGYCLRDLGRLITHSVLLGGGRVHLSVVIDTPRRQFLAASLIYRLAAHIGLSGISIFEADDATALAFNMVDQQDLLDAVGLFQLASP